LLTDLITRSLQGYTGSGDILVNGKMNTIAYEPVAAGGKNFLTSQIFSMGLEGNGLKVNTFNDPQLPLSEFKEGAYDLVILDYKMPKMNGFELYRKIRKMDKKVRVCFLTAFDLHPEDLKRIPLQSIHLNKMQ
jgi:chemotaxis response regulator CheB